MADDGIATCCRMAQQAASARGSSTVEVADFVIAMTAQRDGGDALAAAGLEPSEAAAEAQGMLATAGTRSAGHAPVLSDDLLTLLLRAEARAHHSGAAMVTLADFADALARESRDLASAQFVVQTARRRGETSGARGMRHNDRRLTGRRHRDRPLTQARHGGSSASARDPFQLRVDVGREDDVPELFTSTFADPIDGYPVRERNESNGGQAETISCDTRHLERQIADLAAAREVSARDTGRHRETTQRRLDDMSRDIAALKETISDAFLALQGRLSEFGDARQVTKDHDGDRGTDRLALIEAALKRLEASVARRDSARSSSSGSTTQASRQSGSSSRTQDNDRDGATERDGNSGSGNGGSGWSRSRSRLSNLSRGRRRRSSRSSRSSRSYTSSQSSRSMREPYDGDRKRTFDRDDTRRTQREDRARDVALYEDEASEGDPATKRFYLSMTDDIVQAPSIGPRTASRLTPHGILTVADLLAADAADLAERIDTRYITTQTIEDWQMQSRLVCTIPWLRGTHAQLLVGSGYTSAGAIMEAAGGDFSADILKFASTRDGQRILRNGPPPPLEKIAKWAEFATLAELDRAA